jgi:glyoxylase-like metal-dependent hydrolase (beta-lactamase superfamily II)
MTAPVEPSDNYTGHVEPGTAARRTVPGATILKASVGPMDNNAYLVTCSATGETLLIDAANDAEILIDLIRRYAPKLSLILTSHQHFDHWQALEAVVEATGVPTAAHEIDAEPLPVKPDRLLTNGDTVQIGELTFDVIHLRGHTPGSVALALNGPTGGPETRSETGAVTHLFTGDCLFPGGVGKTWQPGDFEQLLEDVTSRVFDVYDDSTVIYPGHGDDTVLGAERPHLAEWRERGW